MQEREKSYEYHNNILSIPASLLYEDWGVMSYNAYLKKCQRGELTRSRPGKGKGSDALLSYYELPEHLKALCIEKLGHYSKVLKRNDLEPYIVHEGNIDIEFRRLHVGSKFVVRYDPDHMDGYIQLLQTSQYGETYFVAYAEPKRKIETVPKLMRPGEKEQWSKDHSVRDTEYERDKKEYEALCRRTGISPEALIAQQEFEVKMQGTLNKTINIKTDKKKSLITQI